MCNCLTLKILYFWPTFSGKSAPSLHWLLYFFLHPMISPMRSDYVPEIISTKWWKLYWIHKYSSVSLDSTLCWIAMLLRFIFNMIPFSYFVILIFFENQTSHSCFTKIYVRHQQFLCKMFWTTAFCPWCGWFAALGLLLVEQKAAKSLVHQWGSAGLVDLQKKVQFVLVKVVASGGGTAKDVCSGQRAKVVWKNEATIFAQLIRLQSVTKRPQKKITGMMKWNANKFCKR